MGFVTCKRGFWVVLCIVLSLSIMACGGGEAATGNGADAEGFDTPQEAVRAYLEGLKAAELEQMLSTFAITQYAQNYDFEAMLDRVRVYIPTFEIKLPNANAFASELNAQNRRAVVVDAITMQYIAICYFELDLSDHVIMTDSTGETPEGFTAKFTEKLNAMNLDTLNLLGFIPCESLTPMYASPPNLNNLSSQAEALGAQTIESLVAVFELQGNKFMLCLDAISYDGKWSILKFQGNIGLLLGITPYSGGIIPVSEYGLGEGELEKLIN